MTVIQFLSRDSLASHLRLSAEEKVEQQETLDNIVELTNGLLTEKWAKPVDPIPVSVTLLALKVATRAYSVTDPTAKPVESLTRSTDNTQRTERYIVAVDPFEQVYLTRGEIRQLNPRRRRTIRTHVPGVNYSG